MVNPEQISIILANKADELYYIQRMLNYLECIKASQEAQKEDGWSYFTSNTIHDFKDRSVQLENHIRSLEGELLKKKQEANDQISMSMGYL
jgi:hypothetical protein